MGLFAGACRQKVRLCGSFAQTAIIIFDECDYETFDEWDIGFDEWEF